MRMRRFVTRLGWLPWMALALGGCGGGGGGRTPSATTALPRLYPPVRTATPTALIADPTYAAATADVQRSALRIDERAPVDLASAVRERIYSPGPTELLRIVSELDGRTMGIDANAASHPCLAAAPTTETYTFPGGRTFAVKLQCLERFGDGSGWIAFGFDEAAAPPPDGGTAAASDGGADAGSTPVDAAPSELGAFYLVEGQDRGMGGAYRLDRASSQVEAWIAVADSGAPSNSQVLMHLLAGGGSLELAFGGSGVGFCSAHLKTDSAHVFIEGKTNAPPPPGTTASADAQSCDALRAGCFAVDALDVDLGAEDPACAPIDPSSFAITTDLEASGDPGANVTPSALPVYFSHAPTGLPAY